jgi:3-methyladenine DNA glycosylase AlkD
VSTLGFIAAVRETRRGLRRESAAPDVDALARAIGRANTVPSVRRAARAWVRACQACAPREIALAALELARRGKLWWSCEILDASPAARSTLRAREVESLARDLDSWGAVDAFACFVAGPAWRAGILSDASIARWSRSSDRWLRRAALVSTVPLNARSRGGDGDARRTLAVCARLVADRDDMVVKALSWALRALSKPDPRSVRKFLAEHRHELARRVVREVETKLATGVKQPRKRA